MYSHVLLVWTPILAFCYVMETKLLTSAIGAVDNVQLIHNISMLKNVYKDDFLVSIWCFCFARFYPYCSVWTTIDLQHIFNEPFPQKYILDTLIHLPERLSTEQRHVFCRGKLLEKHKQLIEYDPNWQRLLSVQRCLFVESFWVRIRGRTDVLKPFVEEGISSKLI